MTSFVKALSAYSHRFPNQYFSNLKSPSSIRPRLLPGKAIHTPRTTFIAKAYARALPHQVSSF